MSEPKTEHDFDEISSLLHVAQEGLAKWPKLAAIGREAMRKLEETAKVIEAAEKAYAEEEKKKAAEEATKAATAKQEAESAKPTPKPTTPAAADWSPERRI